VGIAPIQAGFVTYNFSHGRFGDRLLSYMHAKWISYKYGLTLLYKPFIYSENLMMDSLEQHLSKSQRFSRIIEVSSEDVFKNGIDHNALYVVPYFPESLYELNHFASAYFAVDWSNQKFVKVLNETVRLKMSLLKRVLPTGVITVAMHVRRGGSFEPFSVITKEWSIKAPQEEFYKETLKHLYTTLGEKPLYVFIFTDDQQPEIIAERFTKAFQGKRIEFDYRREKNDYNINVLDDFFALTQFDCLIRSDSNFSFCASKLKTYTVEITPGDDIEEYVIRDVALSGPNVRYSY
jgi:hypothetical protein